MATRGRFDGAGEPKRRDSQRSAVVGLAVVLALGLATFACVRAWQWVTALDEFRVYPGNLALKPVPWVKLDALKQDMRRTDPTGLLSGGCSFFTPRLSERVAAAYGASPWVRRVVSVRRKFPNSLEISLEVRKPFAIISYARGRVLVDVDGVALSPELYPMPPQGLGRPDVVLAYEPESQPHRGMKWKCEGVAAGTDMLMFLGERGALNGMKVRGLEVRKEKALSNRSPICVVLKTESGAEVKWGLPPGRTLCGVSGASEVSPDAKIQALSLIVRQHRANLPSVEYIDVRWDRPTLRVRASDTVSRRAGSVRPT